jgi:hypothetical protein
VAAEISRLAEAASRGVGEDTISVSWSWREEGKGQKEREKERERALFLN